MSPSVNATSEVDAAGRRPLAVIDGWPITLSSRQDAVTSLSGSLADGAGFILACMNLDHLVKLRNDDGLRSVYSNPRTQIMADGAPVAVLARAQNSGIERSPGPDLVIPLCREAARRGWPVYMFGTREDVLQTGAERLKQECQGLDIRGIEAPPFGYDPRSEAADAAADRMAGSGAKIVLLGLGSPKQEIFAERALSRHPELGLVCIGAALDFLTGEQMRAPAIMRNNGLEWLWRLATSPRRLGMRYLKCAVMLAELAVRRRPRAQAQG